MENVLKILIASSVSFLTLFVLAKLLGKKQIAQLSFVDYAIGISLGSIAAEMACNIETPHHYFAIAMGMFFLLDMFINFIGRKGPFLKRLFKGTPLVLIYEGEVRMKELKKSGIDMNNLLSLCRQQGYFDITKVRYAVFETGGQLSIMPIGGERPTVAKDLAIEIEDAVLPNYLIVDGRISRSGLNEIGKDEKWLLNELNLKSKKELKKILLASYDEQSGTVDVNVKQG